MLLEKLKASKEKMSEKQHFWNNRRSRLLGKGKEHPHSGNTQNSWYTLSERFKVKNSKICVREMSVHLLKMLSYNKSRFPSQEPYVQRQIRDTAEALKETAGT